MTDPSLAAATLSGLLALKRLRLAGGVAFEYWGIWRACWHRSSSLIHRPSQCDHGASFVHSKAKLRPLLHRRAHFGSGEERSGNADQMLAGRQPRDQPPRRGRIGAQVGLGG
jgi:hypothetical protein